MSDDATLLSPRHERCVAEYLKDRNATQPYIRAGCAPRGVQSRSSMMHIGAAIAVGRQRMVQALEITVERMAQECAKAAFATSTISLRSTPRAACIDLAKAGCSAPGWWSHPSPTMANNGNG